MHKTKSPIKDLPIHVPGQTLDKQLALELEDKALWPIITAMVACLLAGLEWYRSILKLPPMPWLYTFAAICTVAWAVWKIRKALPGLRNLRTGLLGEKAVGQYLEENLGSKGYHVLHDIPGNNFNLDHVVVGPTGVFCVETKTRSRPASGVPTVVYDGKSVAVNGLPPDRDPIIQAKAAAYWLHELLEKSTSKKFPVQPIVIFPDWFIESSAKHSEVWVLSHKAVPTFIKNNYNRLAPEDISLILLHLKRYVISEDQTAKA
ncbi:MAG: nuclease-related domain-containing protein [Sediminibacterium sp.]